MGIQARLIVWTARLLAAMSAFCVLGAVMFNIGDLFRLSVLAELSSLLAQLALGCGLTAISSFFNRSIARSVQKAKTEPQLNMFASSNNGSIVLEGSVREGSAREANAACNVARSLT